MQRKNDMTCTHDWKPVTTTGYRADEVEAKFCSKCTYLSVKNAADDARLVSVDILDGHHIHIAVSKQPPDLDEKAFFRFAAMKERYGL